MTLLLLGQLGDSSNINGNDIAFLRDSPNLELVNPTTVGSSISDLFIADHREKAVI